MNDNELIINFLGNMAVYRIRTNPNGEYALWKLNDNGKLMLLDVANEQLKLYTKEYPDAIVEIDTNILHFHDSYNWLMPVVNKIAKYFPAIITIQHNWCRIDTDDWYVLRDDRSKLSSIQAVYECVIEAIKYYNNSYSTGYNDGYNHNDYSNSNHNSDQYSKGFLDGEEDINYVQDN